MEARGQVRRWPGIGLWGSEGQMTRFRHQSLGSSLILKREHFEYKKIISSISRHCMANTSDNGNIQSYPSFLSSFLFNEELSYRNQLPFRLDNADGTHDIAFESLDEIRLDDLDGKVGLPKTSHLQLRKPTSFQEILIENHRNILIDSISEYFLKIQHVFLKDSKSINIFEGKGSLRATETTLRQAEGLIENILSQNVQLSEHAQKRIMSRLLQNQDELSIVADMLTICPRQISSEVVFLISFLLQDCNEIIQHFKRGSLSRQLKDVSIKHAAELLKMPCLSYLFESEKVKKVAEPFEILVQKWMITLFLMKVGVFENELDTKSIDDCLNSDVFSKIDLNDLLIQHLIRPTKMHKQQPH